MPSNPSIPIAEHPEAVRGISSWLLFPGTHIVGSAELDRYIVVPAAKLTLVQEVIAQCDGKSSTAGIADRFARAGLNVNVASLLEAIHKAGLLVGSEQKGEISRLALPIGGMDVESIFVRVQSVFRYLFYPFVLSTGVLIAIGISIFAEDPGQIAAVRIQKLTITHFWIGGIFFLTMALSTLLHELCHGVVATRFGLIPKRLGVVAYLIFIPMFFLKIPGLYTLSPRKRIIVWAAGIWGNFTIAALALIAMRVLGHASVYGQMMGKIALANCFIAGMNMLPFLPTDGYFIMSTILKKPNIRPRAWKDFLAWITLRARPNPMLLAYLTFCLITMISVLTLNVSWLVRLSRRSAAGYVLMGMLGLVIAARLWRMFTRILAATRRQDERS